MQQHLSSNYQKEIQNRWTSLLDVNPCKSCKKLIIGSPYNLCTDCQKIEKRKKLLKEIENE